MEHPEFGACRDRYEAFKTEFAKRFAAECGEVIDGLQRAIVAHRLPLDRWADDGGRA